MSGIRGSFSCSYLLSGTPLHASRTFKSSSCRQTVEWQSIFTVSRALTHHEPIAGVTLWFRFCVMFKCAAAVVSVDTLFNLSAGNNRTCRKWCRKWRFTCYCRSCLVLPNWSTAYTYCYCYFCSSELKYGAFDAQRHEGVPEVFLLFFCFYNGPYLCEVKSALS